MFRGPCMCLSFSLNGCCTNTLNPTVKFCMLFCQLIICQCPDSFTFQGLSISRLHLKKGLHCGVISILLKWDGSVLNSSFWPFYFLKEILLSHFSWKVEVCSIFVEI